MDKPIWKDDSGVGTPPHNFYGIGEDAHPSSNVSALAAAAASALWAARTANLGAVLNPLLRGFHHEQKHWDNMLLIYG